MNRTTITTPGGHAVTILYIAKPPEANDHEIWWLQRRKMGFPRNEVAETYDRRVPDLAKQFAARLLAAADLAPGLVVVPASASRQYQPYLDALVVAGPDLPVLDGAFTKPAGFRAGDVGRTFDQVLDATALDAAKLPTAAAAAVTRVWIVDDIYNTGNTVGAMVTRLKGHLPALADVVVACPLYVPV